MDDASVDDLRARDSANPLNDLIKATEREVTEANVERLLRAVDGRQLSVTQLLAVANMAVKVGHPSAVKLAGALLSTQPIPAPDDVAAVAQRRSFARILLWAMFKVEGPAALIRRLKSEADPTLAAVYAEGFESLCHFSTGDIRAALASRDGLDLGHGLILNGIALYPEPDKIAAELAAINTASLPPVASGAPSSACIVVSCDPVYLQRYGVFFAENLRPIPEVDSELVFFVAGALDPALAEAVTAASPLKTHFVADTPGRADKAFHTINRFVRVPAILGNFDLVVVSDIDARLDLSRGGFLEATAGAAAGWIATDNPVPWLKNLAGFVFFRKSAPGMWAARAIERIIQARYRPKQSNENWYLDQVALTAMWDNAPAETRAAIRLLAPETAAPWFKSVKLDEPR